MKQRRLIVLIVVIAVAAAGAAVAAFYFSRNPAVWEDTLTQMDLAEPAANGLEASGFIEAEEIDIAPQLGGRVAQILVEEGDDVEAGTLLVRLDGALLGAQIASARAGVETAEARLAQVRAGARSQQIRQAEAHVAQAVAAREGAYTAWQDAEAVRDNPQELNARIAAARFEVRSAEAELAEAAALKDAAVIAHDNYWDAKENWENVRKRLEDEYRKYLDAGEDWEEIEKRLDEYADDVGREDEWDAFKDKLKDWYEGVLEEKLPKPPTELPTQLSFDMIPYDYWRAWVGFHTAEARLSQARTSLRNLISMRDNPQDLEAEVDAAEAQYRQAEAAVDQAEAQLDAVRSGATREEIAVVEAQVAQAEASLNRLLSEQDKLTISAPVGGIVLQRTLHESELAAAGTTLLTLGDLDEVTLTVYVPEDQLGRVTVGQEAEVEADSFPDQVYEGRVVAIASEAEFVPRNVQSKEERVNMVFAVDIVIPNPDHQLKPGMTADATLITGEN